MPHYMAQGYVGNYYYIVSVLPQGHNMLSVPLGLSVGHAKKKKKSCTDVRNHPVHIERIKI